MADPIEDAIAAYLKQKFAIEGTSAEPGSWRSEDDVGYYRIRDQLHKDLNAMGYSIDKATVGRVLDRWHEANRDRFEGFPTWQDIVREPQLWSLVQREATGANLLPRYFALETENGPVVYENTPQAGPMPVPASRMPTFTVAREVPPRYLDPETGEVRDDTPEEALERSAAEQRNARQAIADAGRPGAGPMSPDFESQPLPVPVLSTEDVLAVLVAQQTDEPRTGSGRRALVHDRAEIAEGIRFWWKRWLREDPSKIESLVDEFIAADNSLWRAGGRRDFETWVKDRIRTEDKYGTLYAGMDPSQTEEDYLEGFLVAEQFGLDPRLANQQVVRGLSTGAAPAAFQESVSRSRDVMALGQGSFSRRFANMLNQLGPLQRA